MTLMSGGWPARRRPRGPAVAALCARINIHNAHRREVCAGAAEPRRVKGAPAPPAPAASSPPLSCPSALSALANVLESFDATRRHVGAARK